MDGSTKSCARCGRIIEWRKKWADCWDEVKYCSKQCQGKKLTALDKEIEAQMVLMLTERGHGKTVCPSEPLRLLMPDEAEWRPLMESARMAARRLVAAGQAEITQGGRVVDPSTAKGPIRVRKA